MEVKLLKELVSIESPTGSEGEISAFIQDLLVGEGIPVETLPVEGFGDDIIARLPGRGPTVVLNGHMDTVRASEGWNRDPLGEFEGDRFYGLGSADMKGGLAAILGAFIELSRFPLEKRPNVIFTAVSDEEGYSRGAWELIQSGKLEGTDLVLVAEPTGESLMLGARGRLVVMVRAIGKRAHAARPYLGVNAIEELGAFVGSLGRIRLRKHGQLGRGSYCTLHIGGSADGLSVPDEAMAIIDRHIVPGEDWEKVRGELLALWEKLGLRGNVEISRFERPTPEMLPYTVRRNSHFVNLFRSVYRALFGGDPEITYGRSVGDFNYFGTYLGRPTLVYGPIGGNWHSADEWVSVSSVKRVKKFYLSYLRAMI